MTDEKSTRNTAPETAKPEPTLTNPVEQSFAAVSYTHLFLVFG